MDNSTTYQMISDVIELKKLSKEDILKKLDVFLLASRITSEEYQSLINKVNEIYN